MDSYVQNFKTNQAFAKNKRVMKQVILNIPESKYPFLWNW